MWESRIFSYFTLAWILLLHFLLPVTGLFQYTAAELLWLRCFLSVPPPGALHFHPDITLLPAADTSIVGLAGFSTSTNLLSGSPLVTLPEMPAGLLTTVC